MASNLIGMASNLLAMASTLLAMASNLIVALPGFPFAFVTTTHSVQE